MAHYRRHAPPEYISLAKLIEYKPPKDAESESSAEIDESQLPAEVLEMLRQREAQAEGS